MKKNQTSDLSDEEYLRQCSLRNHLFKKEQQAFLDRWPAPPQFPPPQIGLRLKTVQEWQAQEKAYMAEFINFVERWRVPPTTGALGEPAPKVSLAKYDPSFWPPGRVLLDVDSKTTGDEVKKAWQKIKAALRQSKAKRLSGQRRLKLEIYDLYYPPAAAPYDRRMNLPAIAKKLKKPVSTVAYLLGSVCQDIGRVREKGQKRMDLAFDFGKHFPNCAECQRRQSPCRFAEENMGLSEHGLREVTVGDITQAEQIQLRLQQGRKLPRKIDD